MYGDHEDMKLKQAKKYNESYLSKYTSVVEFYKTILQNFIILPRAEEYTKHTVKDTVAYHSPDDIANQAPLIQKNDAENILIFELFYMSPGVLDKCLDIKELASPSFC